MSHHVFTIEVDCDSSDEYDQIVETLNSVGDITDEHSDHHGDDA
jgi:hypothetical protein